MLHGDDEILPSVGVCDFPCVGLGGCGIDLGKFKGESSLSVEYACSDLPFAHELRRVVFPSDTNDACGASFLPIFGCGVEGAMKANGSGAAAVEDFGDGFFHVFLRGIER